jgi:hypothetical protein
VIDLTNFAWIGLIYVSFRIGPKIVVIVVETAASAFLRILDTYLAISRKAAEEVIGVVGGYVKHLIATRNSEDRK